MRISRSLALAYLSGAAAALVLPAGAAAAECSLADAPLALVVDVPDARTIRLADGREVRPAGIESFALLQPDDPATESALAERLNALLAGDEVRLRILAEKPDRYGRLPALLAAPDGALLQEVLAREGLALAVPGEAAPPCLADLLGAENQARIARRGYWSGDLAQLPYARPAELSSRVGRYVIFQGRVISVGTREWRTYLNFGGRWSEDVTVSVESRLKERFGGDAWLEALAGKRVRVRGFLEERSGPLVSLSWPGEIEVVSDPPRVVQERP